MGAIKGFFVGKDGQVQTYWTNEVIADPVVPTPDLLAKELVILDGTMPKQRKDWKKRRKNEIRHTLVRASLVASVFGATLFTMSLAGSDPNWAVGIGGAGINMAWFFTVLLANGGKINVSNDR